MPVSDLDLRKHEDTLHTKYANVNTKIKISNMTPVWLPLWPVYRISSCSEWSQMLPVVPLTTKVVTVGLTVETVTGVTSRTPLMGTVRRIVPGWPGAPFKTTYNRGESKQRKNCVSTQYTYAYTYIHTPLSVKMTAHKTYSGSTTGHTTGSK